MSLMLLVVGGIITVTFLGALTLSTRPGIAQVAGSMGALGFAAFCVFGFLASLEPTGSAGWPWQLAYGLLGTGAVALAARPLLRRRE
ncbi:MAG: hypothetical protein H7A46_21810 [Verrucomicrobiales bacterium]|nr:hypothetical protein [Verrucomicrobiales bacterium]